MSSTNLKLKYASQKSGAKKRGIEWKITFDEWVTWWGEDIHKRGLGHDSFQMQRYGDKGAYELGNIRKGYPRDNSRTNANVQYNRKTEQAAKNRDAFSEILMREAEERMRRASN